MIRILFYEPRIPGNTGNAIRLAAATGAELHLVEPLGFDLTDANLRRAGLDYHDLASLTVHPDLPAAWSALLPARVFAFTTHATRSYVDVAYARGDVLLFGPEPSGLPDAVLSDGAVTDRLRIPMLEGRRSLNLSNSVAIAAYEAWRQLGFAGAGPGAVSPGAAP
ncbi:tRNA (cytidine(34)-2'-O)-methyltransferase [Paraconexibacter sp. AEG42_29]|uniref:Putative tRNA (cytidine(34)-2'-O)-methyltransferase n=1 Tax=Paraconexibacter sp. AEG42_29 TaxID=2997339 RepID=A0AAU7B0Y6_9ACTN